MNNTIRHDKDGGFTVMPLKNKLTAMREFQITQNFGEKGGLGFEYFKMADNAPLEAIEKEAIKVQKNDYDNRFSGFAGKALERPTITVKEYLNGRKPKGGIEFKTKWR